MLSAATDAVRDRARALARAVEPIVGQVYFTPECHARYAALGFSDSPGRGRDGVAWPDGAAYFTSRGSALGQVPGELVGLLTPWARALMDAAAYPASPLAVTR